MNARVMAQPANPPAAAAPAGGRYEQVPEVVKSVNPGDPAAAEGNPANSPFVVLPGYQVELIYTVPRPALGSWVVIEPDPKGRLIASDQNARGLSRITPSPLGSTQPTIVEHLDLDINSVQGLLFAFDSLYCCVNGAQSGLYRFKYDAKTDKFGPKETLQKFEGNGEHGPHALRLSPDGKSIYVLAGNHTLPPVQRVTSAPVQTMGGIRKEPLYASFLAGQSSRIPANWDEDLLLPRQWDANGHARGIVAPGGWVAITDPDGVSWEIFSGGMRNTYDMDFNGEGELFLYDSDMEWDYGAPWYRPTRLTHASSGSEFGWRSGTAVWPSYYPDNLPPMVEFGPGSPVGVTFGFGAKFPAKYQRALYCADWTFGTLYAIHISSNGATYSAKKEEFVSRNALPLTDVTIGKDGAMYFTIGGRNTDSFLYRVTYKGPDSTAEVAKIDAPAEDIQLRKLRRQIESTHINGTANTGEHWQAAVGNLGGPDSRVKYLVPFLKHNDRFIRYAARVGLESMNVALWRAEVLKQTDPSAVIESAIALAHQGNREDQTALINMLSALSPSSMKEEQLLAWCRAAQLVLIRLGEPEEANRMTLLKVIDPLFPNSSMSGNREIVQLLVALKSPTIVERTIALMDVPVAGSRGDIDGLILRNARYGGTIRRVLDNHPDQQRLHYAFVLRNATVGWSPETTAKYYKFLQTAQGWTGGSSYRGFVRNIDMEAFANLPEKDRLLVIASGVRQPYVPPELPKPKGPERNWTIEEVRELAKTKLKDRDFENGEISFQSAKCFVCHRFGDDGGATGPDLTNLAGRFSIESLTEAIFEPSKAISDQYRAHQIATTDGKVINGRVVNEVGGRLTVIVDPEDPTKLVDLQRSNIEQMKPSDTSLMPANLLKPLNEDEVLDLMAYLLSRGDATNAMFKQLPAGQRRGARGAAGRRGAAGARGAGGRGERGGRDGAPGAGAPGAGGPGAGAPGAGAPGAGGAGAPGAGGPNAAPAGNAPANPPARGGQ